MIRRIPAGRTRVTVPARIGGRALEPGTYFLDLGSGGSVVVAVFAKRPSPARVRAQLRQNACHVAAVSAAAAAKAFRFDRLRLLGRTTGVRAWTDGLAGTGGDESGQSGRRTRVHVASAISGASESARDDSPFGISAEGVMLPEIVPRMAKPVLAAGLFAAALLLLLAAAPAAAIPHARVAQVVARDRLLVAIAALIVSLLTVFVSLVVGA
jgi:hypothetical protein